MLSKLLAIVCCGYKGDDGREEEERYSEVRRAESVRLLKPGGAKYCTRRRRGSRSVSAWKAFQPGALETIEEETEEELDNGESCADKGANINTSGQGGVRGDSARSSVAPGRLIRAPAINFPTTWAPPGSPDNGTQDGGMTRDEKCRLQLRLYQVQVHRLRDCNIGGGNTGGD